MAKDKKKVLDNDTNILETKRKKSHSVTSNKKYESFNIVSETGDSIYSATQIEELKQEGGEQVYISLSGIRKIVNEELDKRFWILINNKNE